MPRVTEVLLDTAELRRALVAVREHVSRAPDDDRLAHVRVIIDPPDGHAYIVATDRYTIGVATVTIWEDLARYGPEGIAELDLSLDDVADVLRIFRGPKRDEGPIDERLATRVSVSTLGGLELVLTDASGLFPDTSRSLTLTGRLIDSYPDVRRLLARLLSTAMALISLNPDSAGSPIIGASGPLPARFSVAAKAYAAPMYLLQSAEARAALVCLIGEHFAGALMPLAVDGTAQAELAGVMADWRRRLPRPSDAPIPMPEHPTDHHDTDTDTEE